MLILRFFFALACLVLVACQITTSPGIKGMPTLPVTSASFAQSPDILFETAKLVCDAPNEQFVQLTQDIVQCRMVMPPKSTANAILQYDGTIHDLPRIVISFQRMKLKERYVVSTCTFLMVPKKTGGIARVAYRDRVLEQRMEQVLAKAGGARLRTPEPQSTIACYST
ncbi:MAG: hypothetical protein CSA70_09375 [Rhodobacterales bacterium]|nr:MAG: hypothetical protein CSA70_09375 [Rhodobacterales bacterium]